MHNIRIPRLAAAKVIAADLQTLNLSEADFNGIMADVSMFGAAMEANGIETGLKLGKEATRPIGGKPTDRDDKASAD